MLDSFLIGPGLVNRLVRDIKNFYSFAELVFARHLPELSASKIGILQAIPYPFRATRIARAGYGVTVQEGADISDEELEEIQRTYNALASWLGWTLVYDLRPEENPTTQKELRFGLRVFCTRVQRLKM